MGWGGSGAPSHSSKRPNRSNEGTKRARAAANKRNTTAVGALEPPGRGKKKLRMMAKRARFAAQPTLSKADVTKEVAAMAVEAVTAAKLQG